VKDKGVKKLLAELSILKLAADCFGRKIKMMKTVYSQEVTKTIKSKKSGAGISDLCQPQLVWLTLSNDFYGILLSPEADTSRREIVDALS
jgi:hypothetical protein